jgi:hypothetical protein
MRQSIVVVPGQEQIVLSEPPFAQPRARQLPRYGRAVVLITVSVLAATSGSETRASWEAGQARRLVFASSLSVSARSANAGNISKRLAQAAASNPEALRQAPEEHHGTELLPPEFGTAKYNFDGRAGGGDFRAFPPSRASNEERQMQVPQAAVSDTGQSPGHRWAERRSCELTIGTRTLELLQPLEQERHRTESLEQDLAGVRREGETQTALAAKAKEDAGQLQVADSGAAELRKSLQQERERTSLLEQDLAAARNDVETQTALAAKATDDATQVKQAADSNAAALRKSLQQEQERAGRLEQDLAAARRDLEAQMALASKASDDASQLKQAAEQGSAQLMQSLQKEHEGAEALAKDLSTAHATIYAYEAQARKASDQATNSQQVSENAAAALLKSLQQERERAGRLEQDLAAARRDIEAQTALAVTRDKPPAPDQPAAAAARKNAKP